MQLRLTLPLALGLLTLAACTQDFEQFRPGAGGAPQGGGGSTTTTGGGGATTTTGGGGAGGGPECTTPADCTDPGECLDATCTMGSCGEAPSVAGTPCATGVCGGGGTCVGCLMDADCMDVALPVCDEPTNTCVAAGCGDGLKNGTETDIDCGGPACAACMNTLDCAVFSDCISGFCQALVCAPCGSSGDCQSTSFCDNANVCVPKLPQGTACGGNDECQNGNCVDGFCCSSTCNGTCEGCSEALTGMPDGTCSFIDTATDPKNQCAGGPCKTGNCTGTSAACGNEMAGSTCGATTCSNGSESTPTCDANGACNQTATTSCNGHICNGNACDTNCGGQDNQCLSAFYCSSGACLADKMQGGTCVRNEMCTGNVNCVDGFCCNSACSALCQACSAAKNGGTDGTCGFVTAGTDPDTECPGSSNNCDGNGACM